MKIEHVALWTQQLDRLKDFYIAYFEGKAGNKYVNEKKAFASYFISFASGARLEIMHKPGAPPITEGQHLGLIHLAISVGSKEKVDALTSQLRNDGYEMWVSPALQEMGIMKVWY